MDSPTLWWPGPLDAQGLASDAVGDACAALTALAGRRGLPVEVSTAPGLVAASFAAFEHLRVDGRAVEGWAPMSGFVAAADGWVRVHANYPHHADALRVALGATTREDLERAVAGLPASDVEERVVGAGGIATAVRTEEEWAAHPHGRATRSDPWWNEEAGAARAALDPARALPLEGVRVLDLTRVIAGPTCSQALACLGADVLRVDPPQRPELLDQHLSTGMGKRSAEVDLRDGGAQVRGLLPRADVVLVGYRPGSLTRFGLDPGQLLEQHPTLVVGSLSAWGEHGPWGGRSGFDSIVQAASGIAVACGSSDRPGALPVQALDHATGHLLAARVVSLLARGRGGVVRASLLGAARDLLARPRVAAGDPVQGPPVPTVGVGSPYGPLVAVPPPYLLDGRTVERDVTAYGAAEPAWR
ncbi:CoA transferase [Nocardioides solisilvae]|uniref:CoA transferase n=1 Tax=Nocardioides solisilvae TaxID=1542435 RepID=UPI0019519A6F|nr:CoA transferase [Nocardioides solisilvae]